MQSDNGLSIESIINLIGVQLLLRSNSYISVQLNLIDRPKMTNWICLAAATRTFGVIQLLRTGLKRHSRCIFQNRSHFINKTKNHLESSSVYAYISFQEIYQYTSRYPNLDQYISIIINNNNNDMQISRDSGRVIFKWDI